VSANDTAAAQPDVSRETPEWRTDARGREFVTARGRSGILYRVGEETVDAAYERDAKGAADKKPRAKSKGTRKPLAPTQVDLKQIEFALAEALSSPAMIVAMSGDEWGVEHFTTQGPILARNLCAVAEHNPWLRAKLEQFASGESAMANVVLALSLGKALMAYIVPPVIYYVNPPFVSPAARRLYSVPEHGPPPPPSPEALQEMQDAFAAEAAAAAEAA
jgi:hypothetical protein